jgi:hypothetical protein
MNCILKKCPHPASDKKVSACTTLGECGASHALARSREIGGYEVLRKNNPTVDALINAGLVSYSPTSSAIIVLKAVTRGVDEARNLIAQGRRLLRLKREGVAL